MSDIIPLSEGKDKCNKFLASLAEFSEEEVEVRANCKFCTHPARLEAEDKWERSGGSYAALERFFSEYKQKYPEAPSMSYVNIRRHVEGHYQNQIKKIRMKEYTNNLQSIMKERYDQIEMLNALATSLQLKYMEIASENTLHESKQADSMVKLAKIIIDVVKFRAELSGDIKQINIFAEKVMNVWSSAIQSEQDEHVKRRFLEVLDSLDAEVGIDGRSG